MLYELYLQMQGRAGERQRPDTPVFGLTHNLGGFPHQHVCSVVIVGQQVEGRTVTTEVRI